MKFSPLLIACGLVIGTCAIPPATAADRAQIGCVATRIAPAARAAIEGSAAKLAQQQTNTVTPAQHAAVHTAALSCAKQYRWSAIATDASETYTISSMAQQPVAQAIRKVGNDPAVIARIIRGLPLETRMGILTNKPAAIEAYSTALENGGVKYSPEAARLAGVMAAVLVLSDQSAERFAAN